MSYTPEEITEILEAYFDSIAHRQYIGSRYVPIFGRVGESSCDWDNTGDYEPLTIVLYQGNSYTSRQFVPAGADISNTDYWVLTGNFNAQVEQYRLRLVAVENALPIADFDGTDTVKKYIDDSVGAALDSAKLASAQVFDTVADMQSATLEAGMICRTCGFHAVGDAGAAWYEIKDTGIANEMDVIACGDLYAHYIVTGNNIQPEEFGAAADGTADDLQMIQRIIDLGHNVKLNKKTYCVSDTVDIASNNVSIIGSNAASISANESVNPSGSVIKYTGSANNAKAVILISSSGYTLPNTVPVTGCVIENISINGNSNAGFGIYASFVGYSCKFDNIYIQGCITSGFQVAKAWMVSFGFVSCWFNGIGFIVGKDIANANGSINDCSFEHIIGHSSYAANSVVSALSAFAGVGVVLRAISASTIANIDAERNETCGIDANSTYGLHIGSIWAEFNAGETAGIAMKIQGFVDVDVFVLGCEDEVIENKGRMDIKSLEGIAKYNPFPNSNVASVKVGKCASAMFDATTIQTWTALIVDFMIWGRAKELVSSTQTSGKNPIVFPTSGIQSSIMIMPINSIACESFAIGSNGNTLTIPARTWTVGEPYIVNNYNSPDGYTVSHNFGVSSPSTSALTFDAQVCSIRYFYNNQWQKLAPTS